MAETLVISSKQGRSPKQFQSLFNRISRDPLWLHPKLSKLFPDFLYWFNVKPNKILWLKNKAAWTWFRLKGNSDGTFFYIFIFGNLIVVLSHSLMEPKDWNCSCLVVLQSEQLIFLQDEELLWKLKTESWLLPWDSLSSHDSHTAGANMELGRGRDAGVSSSRASLGSFFHPFLGTDAPWPDAMSKTLGPKCNAALWFLFDSVWSHVDRA